MNFADDYEYTLEYNQLFLAVHNGESARISSLLRKYSAREIISRRTLMHVAAARGYDDIFQILIAEGYIKTISFLITKPDINGNTPLHLAIEKNHPGMFIVLVQNSNVNTKNFWGATPLILAALHNRLEFARILIKRGAKIDISDHHYRRTALHHASVNGNLSIVQLLMSCGSNSFSVKDKCLMSPFELAMKFGNLEVIKYFSENFPSLRLLIEKNDELLFACVINNNVDVLNYFINFGVKSESRNLLIESLSLGKVEIWKLLLKCSSKIYSSKEAPLHIAVRSGRLEKVEKLLKTDKEKNPLIAKQAVYIAVETEQPEILKLLLKNQFCVGSCFMNLTPLHIAATFKTTKILEMLLHSKCEINSQTDNYFTPLHFAAISGQLNNFRILLEAGADPFVNKTPFNVVLKLLSPVETYTLMPDNLKIAILLISNTRNSLGLMTSCLGIEQIFIMKMVVARSVLLIGDYKVRKTSKYKGKNWEEECKKELRRMKETNVCDDYNLTFYDILTMSVEKISMYIGRENLLKSLEDSYCNFPAYGEFLKVNIQEGIERKNLMDMCVNSLQRLVEGNFNIQISSIHIHFVTQYLSVQDLRRLKTAFSL
ncbi:ankyrin-3-like [Leptopilina heterotoma]|uniref:ankyrin-3-like n=1 Tax=Leptopilina heterotoma TaxID=63436 RepID=UPI001CA9BAC1|nr:ankyrin-3-like [Leptopilina heterotoma]